MMETSCPLCQSAAVLSRQDTRTLVRVIGALGGFVRGIQQADIALPNEEGPHRAATLLDYITALSTHGIAGISAQTPRIEAFERDMVRQFMGHAYICLRCGTTYDAAPERAPGSACPKRSHN